jgi:tetratricopeptide (TPR) repeat protein
LRDRHNAEPLNVEVCCALARFEPQSDWFEKALKIDPACFDALSAVAEKSRKVEQNFAEAARLYRLAYQQRPTVKLLYRLGECLLQAGHEDEGIQCLMQVLSSEDNTLDTYAVVTIVRHYTCCQQYDKVLEYFQKTQEIHAVSSTLGGARRPSLMKYAWLFKGITHLNYGQFEPAMEALRSAASHEASSPEERWADEMTLCTLGLAEILRSNMSAAESCLAKARNLSAGAETVHWRDVLVNTAYLRQMEGKLDEANVSLTECLRNQTQHPMGFLRMGYLRLCQEQFEEAYTHLQLCLKQATGNNLTYGPSQKAMAHFYMCIALYLEPSLAGADNHEKVAEEHFRSGNKEFPGLARALAAFCLGDSPVGASNSSRLVPSGRPAVALSSGSMRLHAGSSPSSTGVRTQLTSPIRIGMLDLQPKQASTLLLFVERCGASRATTSHQVASPTGAHTYRLQPPATSNAGGSPPAHSLISRAPPQTSLPAGALTSPQFPSACRRLAVGESPVSRFSAQTPPTGNTPTPGLSKISFGSIPGGSPQAVSDSTKPDFGFNPMCASNSPKLVGSASSFPLMGTASTTVPTSVGPSRDGSARDLHGDKPQQPPSFPMPSLSSVLATVEGHANGDCSTDDAVLKLSSRLHPSKLLSTSDFRLRDCISHGEYTVVHNGSLQDSKLEVVVKTLHQKDCIRDHRAVTELLAEVAIIAELSHPCLVTFVGACLEPQCVALVTELAPGGNLHQALHVRHRKLSRNERFQLAIELLEGVHYLHTQRPPIAHLDLKSMNLVLDKEGQHLKICDFGLARLLNDEAEGEGQGSERPPSQGGSPRYMSPECYDRNLGAITVKADVWSSGCILIEIFGETLPYAECGNIQQILKLMLVDHCGPSIPTTIEAAVRDVIASTLLFNASDRVAIAEVLTQVQNIDNKSRFAWSG